ncbi:GGDEF domain-containing protein [Chitinilyticum aquatile]|uniref:GGDEF domain-containing protein n=1 Tax=Chitinilyticum aquatile TaxID=362520 RepID=UPI0009D6C934|nr:GGDEF domain-containing protein [Chitinilyticum aquatile]
MTPVPSIEHLRADLINILDRQQLTAFFQPIAAMNEARAYGHEGLIRGPSNSFLHSPINLFRTAEETGLLPELDFACRRAIIRAFVTENLPGKLFLNINPVCLTLPNYRPGATLELLQEAGLPPQRVVIELTETQPIANYDLLREAVRHYREMGFRIALDDLGEGFSSLRLWSEIRPDFVKIDKYFIQGLPGDAQKRQFVRSIQHIAVNTGTRVIAEGIESAQELDVVRSIGIGLGQGYFLGRPQKKPELNTSYICTPAATPQRTGTVIASSLLVHVPTVSPKDSNLHVCELFATHGDLNALPVVQHGRAIGLLKRHQFIEHFARPYSRELHGQRPCTMLMDPAPLQVEHNLSLQELSLLVSSGEHRYLADGFILVDQGMYLGMGTGRDLMRAITELQITAARYANPLSGLPGNVPIQNHIQQLLDKGQDFVAVYADLDHFKPYNDLYGYAKGDDILQMTGQILKKAVEPGTDFVGHIGGDDFVLLLRSEEWRERCEAILAEFASSILPHLQEDHIKDGGYHALNRSGERVWHALPALSLGAVEIRSSALSSHHEVASQASAAKTMAKRQQGCSLFIERRSHTGHPLSGSTGYLPVDTPGTEYTALQAH